MAIVYALSDHPRDIVYEVQRYIGLNPRAIEDSMISRVSAPPRPGVIARTIFNVAYDTDEDGDRYLLVLYTLPTGAYAEIDGRTYGTLQGIRIYSPYVKR